MDNVTIVNAKHWERFFRKPKESPFFVFATRHNSEGTDACDDLGLNKSTMSRASQRATGVRMTELPISPARLWKALAEQAKEDGPESCGERSS
jgi:hypothetical protein